MLPWRYHGDLCLPRFDLDKQELAECFHEVRLHCDEHFCWNFSGFGSWLYREGLIMTQLELEALPMDKQIAYWKGRMLIAIGEGKMDSELCMVIDLMLRIGYQRGFDQGVKDMRNA
jgi:hypothetical protein